MQRFGARFVQEFARPLSHCRGVTAPRARLRVSPRRACVEVLLAPGDGGSYPNLADHRGNVEYDVARVMATVAGESFVTAPPYAEVNGSCCRFISKVRSSGRCSGEYSSSRVQAAVAATFCDR